MAKETCKQDVESIPTRQSNKTHLKRRRKLKLIWINYERLTMYCFDCIFIPRSNLTYWIPPSKHSSWWRCLEDVFSLRLQKMSSRRLQNVFIKTNIFTLLIRLQKTSSRRFQDVFKPSCLAKASSRHLQDVLKTFSRRIIKLNCSC